MSRFSISQRGYYSLQQELEDAGQDYDQLCRLIVQFQITPSKFPRTSEEAAALIRQHIESVSRSFYNVKGQMMRRSELMIESLRKSRKCQLTCQKFYHDAIEEVGKLNELMNCQLNIYRPRFLETMNDRAVRLGDGQLKILILGEICAGKSSILNLLMDGQYFPVGHGHCTRIPCEVRNDTIRHAYLYNDSQSWARPSASFDLSTNPDDPSWVRVQKCITNGYDTMSDSSAPLHKVVIRWPLKIFQTKQMDKLQRDLKITEAQKPKRSRLTTSEPLKITSQKVMNLISLLDVKGLERVERHRKNHPKKPTQLYTRSEETEVLKPPRSVTETKSSQTPILEYKGVQMPALVGATSPKTPVETSNFSQETDDEQTDVKITSKSAANESIDGDEITSENYDDTLKLVNGITFVDAPGIYDTEESFLNLQSYIQSCDAFFFVISNAENEGMAKDRVMKLMDIVKKTCEEKNNFFNPQCAMFLCNKWDIVDEEEKETLKERVLRRIRECWPTVSDSQLLPISGSKQILRDIQEGKVPKLYEEFYHGTCSFTETVATISIESNCWWLTSLLDKIVVLQRKAKNMANFSKLQQEEVNKNLTKIKKAMLEISDYQNKTSQEIEEDKTAALKSMQGRIKKLLSSKLSDLCLWKDEDIPDRENDLPWRNYHHELNRAVAKRLEKLLVDDEESSAIIDSYEEKIKKKLYDVKQLITQEDEKASYLQPLTASIDISSENGGFLSKAKWPLLVFAMVVTLPAAPLILIFWHLFEELTVPILQDNEESFRRNSRAYMSKQTEIYVEKIIKERLNEIAEARLEALTNNAKHVMHFFFSCIENRLKSIDEMEQQVNRQKVTQGNHSAIYQLTVELSRFYIKQIIKHNIQHDRLTVDIDNPVKIIGGGQCSYVVKGSYFDEKDNEVAVKVIKWPAGEEEAIFRECFMLRQLSQKPESDKTNFVRFYGSTFEEKDDAFKLMLICELCDTDLAKMVQMEELVEPSGNRVPFPGSDPQKGRGWNYFFSLAKQAASGLQFVHNNGIVHRDVKPGNFLVKFSGRNAIVKIADVGLSKDVDLNITTRIGTKIYSAPEVQLGLLHSFSGDVYSLSLVLFELWYGQVVPFQLPERPKLNFYYPAPELRDTRPPRNLESMMKAAWKYVPTDRPTVGHLVLCLNELSERHPFN